MLEIAINLEEKVDTYIKKYHEDLALDQISAKDWQSLHSLKENLQPFYRATLMTQGDKRLLYESLYNMDILMKFLGRNINEKTNRKTNEKSDIQRRSKYALEVLIKYRNLMRTESPYYIAAIALHPSYRLKYFETWPPSERDEVYSKLQELWAQYKELPLFSQPVSVVETLKKKDKAKSPKDIYDTIREEIDQCGSSVPTDDEWELFQQESRVKIDYSPITWWLKPEQQSRWPCLAHMAIDILSIPAMSDEPERIFSRSRRTISWERSRLKKGSIQQLECLKSWFIEGLI